MKRRVKVNVSLRFAHEVLGLERLHYGLWDGEPTTMAGLRSAQKRYSETILGWIPEGVHSILDVGCGVGRDSLELSRRGFDVEGLAPDPYQQASYTRRTGLPFHLCRFQDFRPQRTYDLLFMGESAQYVWLPLLFPKILEVAPGGYLLVADYFLRKDDDGPSGRGHPLPRFLALAEQAGFRLERREDVTDSVLPTLDLGASWLERYVNPTLDIISDSASTRYPRMSRLGWRLFRRPITKFLSMRDVIDRDEFKRTKRYEFLLFKTPSAIVARRRRT